jgi:hypothetical protein
VEHVVGQDARRQHLLDVARGLDPQDPALLDHQQRAILRHGEPVRHVQIVRDLHDLVGHAIALRVEHREHLGAARPDIDSRAALGDRE